MSPIRCVNPTTTFGYGRDFPAYGRPLQVRSLTVTTAPRAAVARPEPNGNPARVLELMGNLAALQMNFR